MLISCGFVTGGGAGGQILVSQEARDLVLEGLRERFSQTVHFNDLGVFQFKGIPEGGRLVNTLPFPLSLAG